MLITLLKRLPLWRNIPHPQYGTCGGAWRACSVDSAPKDELDALFKKHDLDLGAIERVYKNQLARAKVVKNEMIRDSLVRKATKRRQNARQKADQELGVGLRTLPKDMPLQARFYANLAKLVFKP